MFGSTLCKFVDVDGDHVRVFAVVNQGILVKRLEIFVDLPKFSHGGMVSTGGALTFKRHFENLATGLLNLVVSEGDHQSDGIQQTEQLGVVLNDSLDADLATDVIAALTAGTVCSEFSAAEEAIGMQPAQLAFVFRHAVAKYFHHCRLFAHGQQQEVATMNKLFDHLQTYRIELALEEIRRKTDVKASPVTIDTIFTNRSVTFEKEN